MTGADSPDKGAVEPAGKKAEPTAEPEPTERDLAARARGLSAPYLPGGRDPDPDTTRREERRYLLALIGMVVLIVGASVVLTIIGIFAGAFGGGH
jgi:hypothetical protein